MKSRQALEPTKPPTKLIPAALFPGVKRQGREANHTFPSSAEVNNDGVIIALLPLQHVFMALHSIKPRNNFTYKYHTASTAKLLPTISANNNIGYVIIIITPWL
jgi:hypothetical protein